ncbi:MAG TPA: anhydro-N-acetylmuramic acid kinase [Phycisphaerales bacterium]|nr:anhydro-N-acetylmuramic acid kinase [Phycisphaerales bacterium]
MEQPELKIRRVVGCMTGTSLDGIDAALLEVVGEGLEMKCRFVAGASEDLGELKGRLRELAEQKPMTAGAIATLAREFSLLHARVVLGLLGNVSADLICVHGQTVFHKPPVSWQLFEPAPLVHATRTPVVFNLRQADLARGGQGAPISPVADRVLFINKPLRDAHVDVVVNLGGFCNVTYAPSRDYYNGLDQHVCGFDLCACNHVLDFIAREYLRVPFDRDGERALQGRVHEELLHDFAHALTAQAAMGRSLGTGDELTSYIRSVASRVSANDLAATACHAIARAVRMAVPAERDTALVAGGGVKNLALLAAFKQRFTRCETTAAVGMPPEYREAACFAVLGALIDDSQFIYVNDQLSGDKFPLAGNWAYP